MYKILIIILFFQLINFQNLIAEEIGQDKAKRVALNFFRKRNIEYLSVKEIYSIKKENQNYLYVINFEPAGWIIISANSNITPILGYSVEGNYQYKSDSNEEGNFFVNGYVEQIHKASLLKSYNKIASKEWESLSDDMMLKPSVTESTTALKIIDTPIWGQGKNNSGTCSPSYNSKVNSSNGNSCSCNHYPVGCGPVAMAGIMWHWKYPSAYRWDLIPDAIYSSTDMREAEAVANLLSLCGSAANTQYLCGGSFTTVNNIEDAFRDAFNYQAARKEKRQYWEYGSAWENLIRSEIDCNRPVIYRGDKADLSTEKHIWICDGYDLLDPSLFHMNWGWTGSYNGNYRLNDLTPSSSNFNKNQMVVVGISPTINIVENIYDSNDIYGDVSLVAVNDISLPLEGNTLTVHSNSNVLLESGNTIVLKPGFKVNKGCNFRARINSEQLQVQNYEITVDKWINAFSPNGDGINDEFVFKVDNADSWEMTIFDVRTGESLVQTAGVITGEEVSVWKGDGAYGKQKYEEYRMYIRFKNSYGRSVGKEYAILVGDNTYVHQSSNVESESSTLKSEMGNSSIEIVVDEYEKEDGAIIYPNPSDGVVHIKNMNTNGVNHISIFNNVGNLIKKISCHEDYLDVDLTQYKQGYYIIRIVNANYSSIHKIMIK